MCRSKLKNSYTEWQSPWIIIELSRRIILSLQDGMICPSVVIIGSDSWIFCLFICTTLSLFHSPRHESRRRSLAQYWCSLTQTLATSIGILDAAGDTTSWFHSATLNKSCALAKNSLNSNEILYLDDKRNTQRYQSNTNWRHKKFILMRVRVWCHKMLISCCTSVLFSLNLFDFSSTTFGISLFICSSVWRLTLVVLDLSFKVEEYLHKMAISLPNCRVE